MANDPRSAGTKLVAQRDGHSALGFGRGVGAFAQGIAFVVGTPSVWGYALVPVVLAVTLSVSLGAAAIYGVVQLAHVLVGGNEGTLGAIGAFLIELVLGLVALLASVLVAFALAQPLSGFALEAIARRRARAMGAPDPAEGREQAALASFFRSLRVTFTGLAFALPLLALLTLVSLLFPPAAVVTVPLKLLVSALTLAWDLLDYPLGMRGFGVRDRLRWMRARFGAVLGFGLAGSLVLLVPGLGLLMLPMGVAGAASLAEERDPRANRAP